MQSLNPNLAPQKNSRLIPHSFVASVVNWHISGFGDSREEALKDLKTTFAARKEALAEAGKPLPRPGTRVPIGFVSQERVNAHPELMQDFIERVLGLDWAFISDESNLWDFHEQETNEALVERIWDVYGVNVGDIESARLREIFDRIAESQHSSGTVPAVHPRNISL